MRTITISIRKAKAAYNTGETISRAWLKDRMARHDRGEIPYADGEWQAKLVEIYRIPKVMARCHELQRLERRGDASSYVPGEVVSVKDRLPGYVLPGWSNGPREGWEHGHCPGTVWDGIRRNVYCQLVEAIYAVVCGEEISHYGDVLARYKVRLV